MAPIVVMIRVNRAADEYQRFAVRDRVGADRIRGHQSGDAVVCLPAEFSDDALLDYLVDDVLRPVLSACANRLAIYRAT